LGVEAGAAALVLAVTGAAAGGEALIDALVDAGIAGAAGEVDVAGTAGGAGVDILNTPLYIYLSGLRV